MKPDLVEIRVPVQDDPTGLLFLAEWYVGEGHVVDKGQKVVCLETDKAVIDVVAPDSGVITRILKEFGATVTAGEVMAWLQPVAVPGASPPVTSPPKAAASPAQSATPREAPLPVDESATPSLNDRPSESIRTVVEQHHRELAIKRVTGEIDEQEYQQRLAALQRLLPSAAPQPPAMETGSQSVLESVFDVSQQSLTRSRMPADMRLRPGLSIGRFELVELIGAGNMGLAWKAIDPQRRGGRHDGLVVLKFLKPEEQGNARALARSRSVFRLISTLQHSSICPVYDLIEDPRFGCCQVMRFIDGITLTQYRLRKADTDGRVSIDRVARVVASAASALQAAHHHGVLHRDIKPDNLMIERTGRLQVIDFGLADEIVEAVDQSHGVVSRGGTPAYMAPEQLREEKQTAATDQYALAVVAWELLTGERPFVFRNLRLLLEAMQNNDLPPADWLSADVRRIFRKALHPDRRQRFPTILDFGSALSTAAQKDKRSTTPPAAKASPPEATPQTIQTPSNPVATPGKTTVDSQAVAPKTARTESQGSPPATTPVPATMPLPATRPAPPVRRKTSAPALLQAPFDRKTAEEAQAAWAKYLGIDVEITNSLGMKFRVIPPGTFLMGSPASEAERGNNEHQHAVTITRPMLLGVYPVTQGQWISSRMGTNPSHFRHSDKQGRRRFPVETVMRFPVESVSWVDCQKFVSHLNAHVPALKGWQYRLPTEAEWEYACRAGTTTPFWFGTGLNGTQANCDGSRPYGLNRKGPYAQLPTIVGSYPANPFGLFDQHGNVWEWCADWYGGNYYEQSPPNDPSGPPTGSDRVLRGGGWSNDAAHCRTANRGTDEPTSRSTDCGFRLALSPSGQ